MKLIIGGYAQGKTEYAKKMYPDAKVWNHFHIWVETFLEEHTVEELHQYVDEAIKSHKNLVIISDEIGNGIVPMEEKIRFVREQTGRVLCKIAEQAEEVVRVTCGIPQKIK